jgi:hypothetical protein
VENNRFNGTVEHWFNHMLQIVNAGSANFVEGVRLHLGRSVNVP